MGEAINKLSKAVADGYLRVSVGETGRALLSIEEGLCWLSGGNTAQEVLAVLSTGLPEVTEIDASTAEQSVRQHRLPLAQFYWWAGLQYSQGELVDDLQPFPKFRLISWPDFSWMMHSKPHLDMTRVLISQPASLEELSQSAGVTQQAVIAFINACYLCGWVRGKMTADHASQMWQSSEQPDDLPDLISKIRVSLDM